jgi:hypothetical protein
MVAPAVTLPGVPSPAAPAPAPSPAAPSPAAPSPAAPSAGQPSTPAAETAAPSAAAQAAAPESAAPSATGAAEASAALGGETFATGYIDPAIPVTQFRLRFDAAYDDNRPDRAEFFYAKCGCFGGNAPGPARPETRVDYQDISSYLEIAVNDRLSGFVEVPVRFLNPEQNENTTGLADMNAGVKYALLACPDHYLTFQFRTYIPTGAASHGLGTDHVSLEPAILYHQQVTSCLGLDSELRDWIPVGGTDFAGNVIRYGVGLSYLVLNNPHFSIAPVGEIVGWTVLSGLEFSPADPADTQPTRAAGDTIVNAKVGVRLGFGCSDDPRFLNRSDLYVGYGRALTGDVWYKDIIRAEYRLRF